MPPAEDIIIRLRPDGNKLDAEFVKYDQQLSNLYKKADSFSDQLKDWSIIAAGFNQALELSKKLIEAVQEPLNMAAEMEVLRSNFKGSAEDMELFRKATAGTATEANLIKLSNQATDLGLSLKDQAILFSMAEDAADKYGGSLEENFQKVVFASEGNTRGLKELGIQKQVYEQTVNSLVKVHGVEISQLDAESQKRIRLQALLMVSGQTLDDVNKKQADSKDKLEQMAVAAEEAKVKMGEMILPLAMQIQEVLLPTLNMAADNIDAIVPVVKILTVAIAAYTVTAFGAGAASNVLGAALLRLKSIMETLILHMMYNPAAIWIAGIAAVGIALYELNKAYGDTTENQLEAAKATEEANKQSQINIDKAIKERENLQKLSGEYETLKKKVDSGKISAEERQKAETRMHDILVQLQTKYPGIIKSTNDYSKELGNVKTAAKTAADEIGILNGKLTEYQKSQVSNKLVTGKLETIQGFADLKSLIADPIFGYSTKEKQDESRYFNLLQYDWMKNNKAPEDISGILEKEYLKYSDWAANSNTSNAKVNLQKAEKLLNLKNLIDKQIEYSNLLKSSKGIDETGSGQNSNSGVVTIIPSDKQSFGISNELKQAEELKGKLEQLKVQRDELLSTRQKELKILELERDTKQQALLAEEKELKTLIEKLRNVKARTPEQEGKLKDAQTRLNNIGIESQINDEDFYKKRQDLLTKNSQEDIRLQFEYHEKRLQLEEQSDIAILENRKEMLEALAKTYTDPDQKAQAEAQIQLLNDEIARLKVKRQQTISEIMNAVTLMKIENMPEDTLDQQIQKKRDQATEEFIIAWETADKEIEIEELKTEKKIAIWEKYTKTIRGIDRESIQGQIEEIKNNLVNVASAYNDFYSAYAGNARSEIDAWKSAEEKRLEAEHKEALKHATTQQQKEKIDADYAAKKEKLDQQAQDKTTERLKTLWEIQKAFTLSKLIMDMASAIGVEWSTKGVFAMITQGLVIASLGAQIAAVAGQKFPGYNKGGRLKKGETGYFEGYQNEIVAPEKTFIEVFNELAPKLAINQITRMPENLTSLTSAISLQAISAIRGSLENITLQSSSGSNIELLSEVKLLNRNLAAFAQQKTKAYIGDREFRKAHLDTVKYFNSETM